MPTILKKLTAIGDRCCMPNESFQPRSTLVVIGDPNSRRRPLLEQAAAACGCEFVAISLSDALHERWPEQLRREAIVRLESPGVDTEVTRLLLQAGAEPMRQLRRIPVDADVVMKEPIARGEIVHPWQWFLGFAAIVGRLDQLLTPIGVRWMNSPESIITAFDKQACRDLWQQQQVPIAPGLAGIQTYSQLRKEVSDRHARLFVKLRYGYSAMGAVALEWRDERVRVITTTEVVWNAGRPRLFVSKRPRVIQHEFDIAWLFDTLAMEQIVIEEWLPKARWKSKPFDLRIVTVGGQARHAVGRASSSPFTNLNLDADRIEQADLERELEHWPQVVALAESSAACLPEAWQLGIDVLLRSNRRDAVVLEANAFGDYLPGLMWQRASTYEVELHEFLQRANS